MDMVRGDVLLKVYADRMRRFISEKDIVARLGGDEFVILMAMPGLTDACNQQICDLKEILEKEIELNCSMIKTSASIGYALYPDEALQLSELLELADKRMYTQKK